MTKGLFANPVGDEWIQPATVPPAAAASTPTAQSSISARIDSLTNDPARQSRPLIATSVELVGLSDIPAAVGSAWQSISARAVRIVIGELQARLTEPDFYIYYQGFSFMVCYADLDRQAAEAESRELCLDIRRRLVDLVPEIAAVVQVEHFVAEVDRQELRSGNMPAQERLYQLIAKMKTEAHSVAQRSRSALLRDFQLQFAPVWHANREMVVLNRCLLDMSSGPSTLERFQALAEPAQIAATMAEIDYTLVAKAVEIIHRATVNKPMGALLVPVSFATLNSDAFRDEYVRMLEAIPKSYRRLLLIEVTGVNDEVAAADLEVILEPLRDLAKGVSVEIPLFYPNLDALVSLQHWGVAVNVGGSPSVDSRTLMRLKHIAGMASAARVVSLAHRASSIGMAAAVFECGYNYIDGPAVHPLLREPKAPSPLPLVSSMMKMRRAKW